MISVFIVFMLRILIVQTKLQNLSIPRWKKIIKSKSKNWATRNKSAKNTYFLFYFNKYNNHNPSSSSLWSFTSFCPSVGCPGWFAGSWPLSSKSGPGKRRPHVLESTRPEQEAHQNAHRCESASETARSSGSLHVLTSCLDERSTEWPLSWSETNRSQNVKNTAASTQE